MYLDKQNTLATLQAVTASAASTDYLDLSAARDIGVGRVMQMLVTVGTTVTAAGAATVTFQLQNDSASGFGSAVTVLQTDAIPKATLVAGYQFFLPIPVGTNKQYLRLYFSVATGPLTAGTFSVAIVEGIQSNTTYSAPSQV